MEEKWEWVLRYDQTGEAATFREHPEAVMYITSAEREFLWRIQRPKEFQYVSCRFCQKEGVWGPRGFEIHLGACRSYLRFLELRGIRERLGRQICKKRLSTIYLKELAEEDVFHRANVIEFSGAPELNEAAIIHDLIESGEKWSDIHPMMHNCWDD